MVFICTLTALSWWTLTFRAAGMAGCHTRAMSYSDLVITLAFLGQCERLFLDMASGYRA